ncbi:hypothetical protein [Paenibacillus macerans]|uniref:hypothetical protein n=1 Tax=Paenibacillus macerans TaxID=44252 RepID=UPI003D3231A2
MSGYSVMEPARLFGESELDQAVERLFAALPNVGTNEAGEAARSVLVNRMKGATPGRATTPYIGVQGKKFIEIFFPHYSVQNYQGDVSAVTGLPDDFWSGFSVAVLCEAMWNITSDLRPQLMIDRIRQAVASSMGRVHVSATAWYTHMLSRIGVQRELSAIPENRYPEAAAIYIGALRNPAWIQAKIVQYESGTWTNRDWELYHHWVKLAALGAGDAAINETIQYLVSRQLPVPDEVRAGVWRAYRRWLSGDIGWGDVRGDATGGILREECYVYNGIPSCMKESNSFEFTAHSQPGNGYRQTPSSSCFERGTLVLMSDGTKQPIENVKAGQSVLTPAGPKTVLMVSTPLRARRPLYRFQDSGFRFAATHPFVNYRSLHDAAAQPAYLCVDPLALINMVPTLSTFGVAPLQEAVGQLCRYGDNGISGMSVPPIVGSTDEQEGDVLYDLIVDFSHTGRSEYYVGDEHFMVLASSEIPRFHRSPEGAHAILALLQGSRDTVLKAMEPVSDGDFADVLQVALTAVSQALLKEVLAQWQNESGHGAALAEAGFPGDSSRNIRGMQALEVNVSDALTLFTAVDNGCAVALYQGRMGTLYDQLAAQFGMPFIAAIDLGWRNMARVDETMATLLSVSVYALELDGGYRLPEEATLELHCSLLYEGARFDGTLPVFSADDAFCHTFDQSLYFDMWRPQAEGCYWSLQFQLVDRSTGEAACATSPQPLPNSFGRGLRIMKTLVQAKDGSQCGQITFDARPLNDLIYAQETAARGQWTADKKHLLAEAIGLKAADYLNRSILPALRLFGNTANAQTGSIFPPLPLPPSPQTADRT